MITIAGYKNNFFNSKEFKYSFRMLDQGVIPLCSWYVILFSSLDEFIHDFESEEGKTLFWTFVFDAPIYTVEDLHKKEKIGEIEILESTDIRVTGDTLEDRKQYIYKFIESKLL